MTKQSHEREKQSEGRR